ncbi:MAG: alpha/beta family hydrolase [Hyphomonadaceae bacterium]|nr:alpha/beta family hydrolase [Hyphomonadaceae bacterium]
MTEPVSITLANGARVSGLWQKPDDARACLVLAHGAGAGMQHKAMAETADGLAARGVAVLRYNFLYMEQGGKRPDAPALAHTAVRAAIARASELAPDLALFAGGRSFGGRMTSQTQAASPLPHVRGLVFFAFPLHPAGKPAIDRAAHLADVKIPMLFLQGEKDALAQFDLLQGVVQSLGYRATLQSFPHADHSFHAPKASGVKDADIREAMLNKTADFIRQNTPP